MNVPATIRTKHLVLRRHLMRDTDAFASFLTDPAATRFMAFTPEQRSRAGAQQMLTHVIASYDSAEPILSLTIADPGTGRYLGSCGANPDEGAVEIYYTVLPSEQGRGIATEAVRALVGYLWATTAVAEIVAYVVPENVASVRVAQRLGFVDAGPVRRRGTAGELEYETLTGHRYVLERELDRSP